MQTSALVQILTSAKIAMVVANKSVIILKDLIIVHVAVDLFPRKVIEKNAKRLKIIITIHISRHQEEFMTMMIYDSLLLDYILHEPGHKSPVGRSLIFLIQK